MRPAFLFGRFCLHRGAPRVLRPILRHRHCFSQWTRRYSLKDHWRRPPPSGILLFGALTPAAFLQLTEEESHEGKTGEKQMLEASREEIKKKIPEDVHGLRRILRSIVFVLDQYVYEPVATGLRFLHLVIIFVPVIVTVPAIWVGARQKEKDNERTGTLWWYGFLVKSMEEAGPAFIKV